MESIKDDYQKLSEKLQISDAVYEALRERIIQNKVNPTFRFKEEEIAAMLDISRTPVREALLLLEHNKYIISNSSKGYIINRLSMNESMDIIDYTRNLRCAAAEITASHITKQQIIILEQLKLKKHLLLGQDKTKNISSIYMTHQKFHLKIAKFSQNIFLYKESQRMHEKLLMIHYYYTPEMKDCFSIDSHLEEHEKLLEAFKNMDSKEARKVMDYYSSGLYYIIRHMYSLEWNE
ncbi:MAG: GntR family transcriptional regulator [Eubacteriales bacterium]